MYLPWLQIACLVACSSIISIQQRTYLIGSFYSEKYYGYKKHVLVVTMVTDSMSLVVYTFILSIQQKTILLEV